MNGHERTELEALRAEQRETSAKVDRVLDRLDAPGGIYAILKDHEARLRSTERWKLSLPIGSLVALGTIVVAVVGKAH